MASLQTNSLTPPSSASCGPALRSSGHFKRPKDVERDTSPGQKSKQYRGTAPGRMMGPRQLKPPPSSYPPGGGGGVGLDYWLTSPIKGPSSSRQRPSLKALRQPSGPWHQKPGCAHTAIHEEVCALLQPDSKGSSSSSVTIEDDKENASVSNGRRSHCSSSDVDSSGTIERHILPLVRTSETDRLTANGFTEDRILTRQLGLPIDALSRHFDIPSVSSRVPSCSPPFATLFARGINTPTKSRSKHHRRLRRDQGRETDNKTVRSFNDEDVNYQREDRDRLFRYASAVSCSQSTEEEDVDNTPRASREKVLGPCGSPKEDDQTLRRTCVCSTQSTEATTWANQPTFAHALDKWERLKISPRRAKNLGLNPAASASKYAEGGEIDNSEAEPRDEKSSRGDRIQPDNRTVAAVQGQPGSLILASAQGCRHYRQASLDTVNEDFGPSTIRDVECQPRQTAFDLSVILSVTTLLCPPQYSPTPAGNDAAHVRITFQARLHPVLAGDDSAELFAFPIVISNGLRGDETCRLGLGESTVHLQNSDFPFHLPENLTADGNQVRRTCSVAKERPTTITLVRYAEDLADPIDVFFEITYALPYADRGSYLSVIVPTFRPRVGVVRKERVYMAWPNPPLVMKARARGVGSSWNLHDEFANDVLIFERLLPLTGVPPATHSAVAADDLCLEFHRWPSVVFDDGLSSLYHPDDRFDVDGDVNMGTGMKVPRIYGSSRRRHKLAWDARIELSRLLGATVYCRLVLNVSVGSDPILLVIDPCGWLASHFVVDGRCLTSSSSKDEQQQEFESKVWPRNGSSAYEKFQTIIQDADWTGKCLQDDQGHYVVMRQPTMSPGKVVRVEMSWYESPLVHEYCLKEHDFMDGEKGEVLESDARGKGKTKGWCEAPLPKIVSHDVVGARLTSELDDLTLILTTNPPATPISTNTVVAALSPTKRVVALPTLHHGRREDGEKGPRGGGTSVRIRFRPGDYHCRLHPDRSRARKTLPVISSSKDSDDDNSGDEDSLPKVIDTRLGRSSQRTRRANRRASLSSSSWSEDNLAEKAEKDGGVEQEEEDVTVGRRNVTPLRAIFPTGATSTFPSLRSPPQGQQQQQQRKYQADDDTGEFYAARRWDRIFFGGLLISIFVNSVLSLWSTVPKILSSSSPASGVAVGDSDDVAVRVAVKDVDKEVEPDEEDWRRIEEIVASTVVGEVWDEERDHGGSGSGSGSGIDGWWW